MIASSSPSPRSLSLGIIGAGLVELNKEHALAHAEGGQHAVRLFTDKYGESPLEVRGPGGGPVFTAAGVLADLMRLGLAL